MNCSCFRNSYIVGRMAAHGTTHWLVTIVWPNFCPPLFLFSSCSSGVCSYRILIYRWHRACFNARFHLWCTLRSSWSFFMVAIVNSCQLIFRLFAFVVCHFVCCFCFSEAKLTMTVIFARRKGRVMTTSGNIAPVVSLVRKGFPFHTQSLSARPRALVDGYPIHRFTVSL